jgi:hypothetical protein
VAPVDEAADDERPLGRAQERSTAGRVAPEVGKDLYPRRDDAGD